MYKRLFLVVGTSIVLAVGWYLVSPLFLNREIHEAVPASSAMATEVIARGTFRDADSFHKAAGTATVLKIDGKQYLRFENDFVVTNGPDLFVHFTKNGIYDATARIAMLKGNRGAQNYEIPSELNLVDYNGVVIWCRAFSVLFGTATWK